MTDREYVEATVAYLAEHVPWMWRDLLDEYRVPDWERDERVPPATILENTILDEDCWYDMAEGYEAIAKWLREQLHPKGDPLVSADWWDERGESKLGHLIRHPGVVFCSPHRDVRSP